MFKGPYCRTCYWRDEVPNPQDVASPFHYCNGTQPQPIVTPTMQGGIAPGFQRPVIANPDAQGCPAHKPDLQS